jgi:hypothetical protein
VPTELRRILRERDFFGLSEVGTRSVFPLGDLTPPAPLPRRSLGRFRQEYRLERKLLNDLSIDPVSSEDLLSSLTSTLSPSVASPCSSALVPTPRHRISRVVVLHNDKLETFSDDDNDDDENEEEDSEPCGRISPLDGGDDTSSALSANFFDNDSFWSGSITWY